MNAEKASRLHHELNGLAKKVFDCVPIAERWTCAQIVGEMKRKGANVDFAIVQGALNGIVNSGLVRCQEEKYWQVPVKTKEKAPPMPEKPQEANVVELVQASKKDTLSELAKIGREMRVAAERIIALSKEIDDAAIAAEQRIAEANNAADKLKQLQSLLKGLT